MHLFQIENITMRPLSVIAEDFDHAAQIFIQSLISGLLHKPDVEFAVSKWLPKPPHGEELPWSFVKEGNAGMLWRVDDGRSWELVQSNPIRD